MKKVIAYAAAAIMTVSVMTACGTLASLVSNASSAGAVAGKALKVLLDKYLGKLGNLANLGNLGNLGNIFDLGDAETVASLTKVASSIQGLKTNSSADYLAKFAEGLVSGSGNAISQQAATSITKALSELAKKQDLTSAYSDSGASQQASLQAMATPVANILKMMQ